MKNKSVLRHISVISIILLLMLTSCISTKIVSYTDSSYDGTKYSRVLVEVNSKDLSQKKIFEEGIAFALNKQGISASPAIELISPTENITESLKNKIKDEYKIDAWIVVSIISKDKDSYVTYDSKSKMSYTGTITRFTIRTELFDTSNWKCQWISSCESESKVREKYIVEKTSEKIVKQLQKDGLISKR